MKKNEWVPTTLLPTAMSTEFSGTQDVSQEINSSIAIEV